jgi:cytochrome c peroxidase
MAVSIGIAGQAGSRSAPSVLNTAYGKTMFWDGRAPSLEAQAQGPIQNAIEMGKQSYKEIVDRLRKVPSYREQFEKVFGTNVTLDGMAKAIASFERVAALSGNSKYDKYNAGENKILSDSEKRGMVLFGLRLNTDDEFKSDAVLQKAKCTLCHQGFNFTDEQFHNLGVGWVEKTGKFADLGRWAIDPIGAKSDASFGSFKTPTVRDAEKTGPYMHDGSLATLEEVVDHYDKGGTPNPALDTDMKKLNLTKQEKADVVAFMKALTGENKELDELLPTLPPGPDGKTVDPRPALIPPSKRIASVLEMMKDEG